MQILRLLRLRLRELLLRSGQLVGLILVIRQGMWELGRRVRVRLEINSVRKALRLSISNTNSRIEMRGGTDGSNGSTIYVYNPSNQLSTVISEGTFISFL